MEHERGAQCSGPGQADGRSAPAARRYPGGPVHRAATWTRTAARAVVVALATGQAGQSMVEYAVVVFLIAIVAMVAVRALGAGVAEVFQSILASFRTVLPAGGGGS
jgi:Flp pilus assembly pilin Flp